MSPTTQTPDESLITLTANAVRKAAMARADSSGGFLVLDSSMNPIYVSQEAAQILMYPEQADAQKKLGAHLTKKLCSLRFSEQSLGTATTVIASFRSGKRQYLCRAFQLNGVNKENSKSVVALLFERGTGRPIALAGISEQFHLTVREREVAQHLLLGLTSKEIGMRMKISPHTVKAFIRLIMVKMRVSTRSAIVVKALTPTKHVMGHEP